MSTNNLPQSIELFIFNFCPFAQRAQMSLIQSQLAYKKTLLDPANIPKDFSSISPLGNVPVLLIDNKDAIFESAVINDYIAQISPISLKPDNAVQCAQMRAWSEYSGTCMGAMMQVLQAEDITTVKEKNKLLISKFDILANQMQGDGPFFYGKQFTTIDSSYAPLFLRMKILSDLYSGFLLEGLAPRIQQWMNQLLHSDILKQATEDDFPQIYRAFISRAAANKFIDTQLG